MKEEEIWKPIVGFENEYEVSSQGRVRSLTKTVLARGGKTAVKKGQIRLLGYDKDGYLRLGLYRKQKGYYKRVNRLVATAFINNPENKPLVNHKNGIKVDNNVNNLEWATESENMRHAHDTGLKNSDHTKGEKCIFSKLKESDVIEIRKSYNKKTCNYKKLADKYQVSQGTISLLIRGLIWSHVI